MLCLCQLWGIVCRWVRKIYISSWRSQWVWMFSEDTISWLSNSYLIPVRPLKQDKTWEPNWQILYLQPETNYYFPQQLSLISSLSAYHPNYRKMSFEKKHTNHCVLWVGGSHARFVSYKVCNNQFYPTKTYELTYRSGILSSQDIFDIINRQYREGV